MAAIASRWFRRKASQRLVLVRISRRSFHPTRDGSLGKIKTEHEEFLMYSRCSPRWVVSDHPKEQLATSFGVGLLPTCVRTLEIASQYIRKPFLCQRTTVSGVTMIKDCFQADQTRRAITQKSLSKRPRLGRGCRRFSTASCCRNTGFSKTRFPQLRNRRIRAPIQRNSRLNMARSYTRSTIGSLDVSC